MYETQQGTTNSWGGDDEEGELEEEESRTFLHHFAAGCRQLGGEQLVPQRP